VGISGILVVDKPAGPTSFDVVKRVRRLFRAERAGHAGTLDPAATGVLAVCLEGAVRIQQFLVDGDKAYEATVAFGVATDTEDAEGREVARGDPSGLSVEVIRAALPRFQGEIEQVPPMYSAVHVGGRRLHEAARAGEEVERAPRRVVVHALTLLEVAPAEAGLLRARLLVRCGKGTYVRTLAADLGRALGVPAHLAALRRTAASGFTLAQAVPLDQAEALAREGGPEALRGRLVSPEAALGFLPALALSAAELWDLVHGRPVRRPEGGGVVGVGPLRAVAPDGRLAAVGAMADGRFRPARVLLTPSDVGAAAAQER
jgi:tRNA pseudouridine55 synthase